MNVTLQTSKFQCNGILQAMGMKPRIKMIAHPFLTCTMQHEPGNSQKEREYGPEKALIKISDITLTIDQTLRWSKVTAHPFNYTNSLGI